MAVQPRAPRGAKARASRVVPELHTACGEGGAQPQVHTTVGAAKPSKAGAWRAASSIRFQPRAVNSTEFRHRSPGGVIQRQKG